LDSIGHSWGSYLGLFAVRGHPEYYRAFVGMGQLAGTREQVRALRLAFLSRAAQSSGDAKFHFGYDTGASSPKWLWMVAR